MKNLIIGYGTIFISFLTIMTIAALNINSKNQLDLDYAVRTAAYQTLEQISDLQQVTMLLEKDENGSFIKDEATGDYKVKSLVVNSDEKLIELFNDNLSMNLRSQQEVSVKIIEADVENGILSVYVSCKYMNMGIEREISTTQTVIKDNIGKTTECTLITGQEFYKTIPDSVTEVKFTKEIAPSDAELTDVSVLQNGSIVAWTDENVYKVSTQNGNRSIRANSNSSMMFYGKSNLTKINTEDLDMSKCKQIDAMFKNCYNLSDIDVSEWDVSNVENMKSVFGCCTNLEYIDVSNWDVSNVTTFTTLFAGDKTHSMKIASLDLGSWNMTNAKNITGMFGFCEELEVIEGIGNWKFDNLTDAADIFFYCSSLTELDLNLWNMSKVKSLHAVFNYCTSLVTLKISNWDVSNVENMNGTFNHCESLKVLNLSNWNPNNLTTIDTICQKCYKLEEIKGIENWTLQNLTNIQFAFNYCYALEQLDLSNAQLGNVTKSQDIFNCCYKLASIKIPDSLRVFGNDMFCNCRGYDSSSFYISENAMEISKGRTFCDFGTENFKEFIVSPDNKWFKAIDGCLYSFDGTRLIAIPNGKTFEDGKFVIPEGVTSIDEYALSSNKNIKEIVLPNSYNIHSVEEKDAEYDNSNYKVGLNISIAISKNGYVTKYRTKDDNEKYKSINGCLYTKDGKSLVAVPLSYGSTLTIEEGTERIEKNSITTESGSDTNGKDGHNSIVHIEIPSSVTFIDSDVLKAINSLPKLESITISADNEYYSIIDDKLVAK